MPAALFLEILHTKKAVLVVANYARIVLAQSQSLDIATLPYNHS